MVIEDNLVFSVIEKFWWYGGFLGIFLWFVLCLGWFFFIVEKIEIFLRLRLFLEDFFRYIVIYSMIVELCF